MTDQRPIDPSTLRDGDIVRAKRGEHGVVEGMFCRLDRGGWCLHDGPVHARETAWSAGGWTITDVLRPVLVKGDRVKWRGAVASVEEVGVDDARLDYPHNGNGWVKITDCTRLPAAPEPEPDPVCPFEMGARVVVTRSDAAACGQSGVVAGWRRGPGMWFVDVEGVPGGWLPSSLALAPEPAPIEVGDWWRNTETGNVHVVSKFMYDTALVRSINAPQGRNERPIKADYLRERYEHLDGPPEPPVGSIVRLKRGSNWRVAVRRESGWATTGSVLTRTWSEVLDGCDASTLQIVHTLGVG